MLAQVVGAVLEDPGDPCLPWWRDICALANASRALFNATRISLAYRAWRGYVLNKERRRQENEAAKARDPRPLLGLREQGLEDSSDPEPYERQKAAKDSSGMIHQICTEMRNAKFDISSKKGAK